MNWTSPSLKEFKEEYKRVKERIEKSDLSLIMECDKTGVGYTSLDDFINNGIVGRYQLSKTLGVGSFSRVHLGKSNNTYVAVKIISKYTDVINKDTYIKKEERVLREVLISSLTSHENIVRLLDFLYNEYYYFMIFESVNGNQLLDLISNKGALSERKAKKYFKQILSAVNYLHDNSIVHRDLKIENILVDKNDNIKIIDFGLSNFYDKKELLNTFCGSLYFAAPELLTGTEYCGPEVDIWALGVILFVLVCGKVPFDDKDLKTLHKKIKSAKLHFNKDLSKDLINLLNKIIVNNPKQRMSMEEILNNPWISKSNSIIYEKINNKEIINNINSNYIDCLWGVIKYQFPNFKTDILQYFKICKEDKNEERLFWTFSPSVSLYFMLKDNFVIDSNEILIYNNNKEEDMSKFVKLLFNENSNYFNKKCITHSNLRKKVIDFFKRENINYETKEKNYICKMTREKTIEFNISLYCNKKIGKHFLTIKKIKGNEDEFKFLIDFIKDVLIN